MQMLTIRRAVVVLAASVPFLSMCAACGAQPASTDAMDASEAQIERIRSIRESLRRFGIADAPEKPAGTFRLTNYNIENLFDDHDDPSLSGRDEDIDDRKPDHELAAAALAIREIDPDILCLQEVESRQALDWFVERYLGGMGYEHIVSIDAGNSRGIENAVLSRHPIVHHENWPNKPLGGVHPEKYGDKPNWYAGEPIAFRRSPLRVDVEIPGGEGAEPWTLTMFVMHHKSGRYNDYWREAEARGTLKLIEEVQRRHPDRAITVLGDFNAQIGDTSVDLYLQNGFKDLFGDAEPSDEIVTHESGRRIDMILANEPAYDRIRADEAFVYGTAARPASVDWREMATFKGYASDHYPVTVDVSLHKD
mgnify:CR=1 FL=1